MHHDFSHVDWTKLNELSSCRLLYSVYVETLENISRTSCPTEKSSFEKRLTQFNFLCLPRLDT